MKRQLAGESKPIPELIMDRGTLGSKSRQAAADDAKALEDADPAADDAEALERGSALPALVERTPGFSPGNIKHLATL